LLFRGQTFDDVTVEIFITSTITYKELPHLGDNHTMQNQALLDEEGGMTAKVDLANPSEST
jgi:hypothetical protein